MGRGSAQGRVVMESRDGFNLLSRIRLARGEYALTVQCDGRNGRWHLTQPESFEILSIFGYEDIETRQPPAVRA